MQNTPRLALPYPTLTDAPNVPSQMQALATALEALRVNARVNLASDFSFTSDGQNYTVPMDATSGWLNGMTLPSATRLTVPKAGIYSLSAQARLTRGSPSASTYTMQVRKNSAESIAGGSTVAGSWGIGSADTTLVTSIDLSLAAGDYLTMYMTALNGSVLKAGSFATLMSISFRHF